MNTNAIFTISEFAGMDLSGWIQLRLKERQEYREAVKEIFARWEKEDKDGQEEYADF